MAKLFGVELPEPHVEIAENGDSVMVLRQNGEAVAEVNFTNFVKKLFAAVAAKAPPVSSKPNLKVVK